MSDGITDMYRAAEARERSEDFWDMFANYLLNNRTSDKNLVESAMAAGSPVRDLFGDFGWTGKENEKKCKKKLDACMKKLYSKDVNEWTLFMFEFLRGKGPWSDKWKKLIEISPFNGCELVRVMRGGGTINVGEGLGPTLWDKAKSDLGLKWEEWDGYGLAVINTKDIKIFAKPKERSSIY